jgi:GT2 family glycosyltransferase
MELLAVTEPEILVVLPTLGDRLDTLQETLNAIDDQRRDVALTLVVIAPVGAQKARDMAFAQGAVLVDDPKVGISSAINAGLTARTTEKYYAWMGDDDLFRPGGLLALRTLIAHDPRTVVAFGGCDYISPSGEILASNRAGKIAPAVLAWGPNLIPHPGAMIALDALEAVGAFDEKLKFTMDLDVFLKLRHLGKFAATRTVVSAFRWHPDSLTVANRELSGAEAEMVKRRHLPRALRPFSFLWVPAVRWASARAAQGVGRRAKA